MKNRPSRKERPCPYCGRPSVSEWFPFCSERCRLIDLGAWFNEAYAIPAEDAGDEETERPQQLH